MEKYGWPPAWLVEIHQLRYVKIETCQAVQWYFTLPSEGYSPAKLSLGVADQPNGQRLVSSLIRLRTSVTRFGEISPLRQNVKKPWQFFEGWFNVWHCLNLLWLINYDNNQFFIVRIAKSKKIILPSGHIAQSQVLIPCS